MDRRVWIASVLFAAAVTGCSSAASPSLTTTPIASSQAQSAAASSAASAAASPPEAASASPSVAASPAPSASAAASGPSTAPTGSAVTFEDGTYQVPSEVKPGTYRTREASSGCYWARLKDFSGAIADTLSNEYTNDPAVVTISKTDKGFESSGCGTWTSDLSPITTSTSTFAGGTFIVGTDISAGRYHNDGQQGCYWERLSGFSGDIKEVIANNYTDVRTVVTIAKTDKGFKSHDCGTWSKA